jgi:predicted transcriptional regulator
MTRIVHNNYPVDRLPEDLQLALGNATHVRLTVEDKEAERRMMAELNAAIDEGIADVEAGRVHSFEEVMDFLAKDFPLPDEKDHAV